MSTAQVLDWKTEDDKVEKWHELEDASTSQNKFQTESPSNIELKAEIAQAKRILRLEDDWDGEGSLGYSEDTFNRATAFLTRHVKGLWERWGIRLPIPRIGPGPDGSIDLHWKLPSRELLVNISADANEVPTFYGDNYGALKNRGTLDPQNFNLEIAAWLMN